MTAGSKAASGSLLEPRDMARHAADAARLLKALANEHRLVILCQLVPGECSVAELLDRVPLGQSALSQHLAILRRDGLVRSRREARTVFYALSGYAAPRVLSVLYELYCAPQASGR